jgi:hypothetical protein
MLDYHEGFGNWPISWTTERRARLLNCVLDNDRLLRAGTRAMYAGDKRTADRVELERKQVRALAVTLRAINQS